MAQQERTPEMADRFVDEVRRDLEKAAMRNSDLPPRLRAVHTRAGHSTPEYRTFAVPVPAGGGGASPEVLSAMIEQYATTRAPCCLLLALDCLASDEKGEQRPVLIAEARDRWGTRRFFMQPFRVDGGVIAWEEPVGGGWQDPGEAEMILDAAFQLQSA